LTAHGQRIDDGNRCTLLVIHEPGDAWAVHGLGAAVGGRNGRVVRVDPGACPVIAQLDGDP
jgi:hypothetical protein